MQRIFSNYTGKGRKKRGIFTKESFDIKFGLTPLWEIRN